MTSQNRTTSPGGYPDQLTFGTDGWRDIIGDKYTVANVRRAAQAYADYLKEQGQHKVVIGYDTRFNSELFARTVAEVLAANGLNVLLSASFIPTPALSFAVKHYGAAGGVMLTASHNPPSYHGFKLKGAYGGTATQDIYSAVSDRVAEIGPEDVAAFDPDKHGYQHFDIRQAYFDALAELVDLSILESFKGKLVHDAMGGAAAGWLEAFFDYAGLGGQLEALRAVPNSLFYGVNPEPMPQNLSDTMLLMQESEAVFATATDGDGDRLGVVLPGGAFFNSHQIFAVLLDAMNKKGRPGKVVKTFTVSRVIERLAQQRGIACLETPVGFKYIVDAMLQGNVLIGGEESGGIGVAGHIPERDGVANTLLLLEAVVKAGKGLKEIFSDLERETCWQHAYHRLDVKLEDNALKTAVMTALEDPPSQFAGRQIESVETLDGCKFNLSGHAWLLFRASGTEPVLRVYCEAASQEEVADILAEAQAFVEKAGSQDRLPDATGV